MTFSQKRDEIKTEFCSVYADIIFPRKNNFGQLQWRGPLVSLNLAEEFFSLLVDGHGDFHHTYLTDLRRDFPSAEFDVGLARENSVVIYLFMSSDISHSVEAYIRDTWNACEIESLFDLSSIEDLGTTLDQCLKIKWH